MTADDLRALVATPEAAAVLEVDEAEAHAVAIAAEDLGFAVMSVDLRDVTTATALFACFARDLSLPWYFGHNWDALDECLRDLAWVPARGYVIRVAHVAALRRAAPGDYAELLDVLETARLAWVEQRTPFWALVS